MSKPLIFDSEARAEYDRACDHYEDARRGYGDIFEARIEATLELIAAQPRLHAVIQNQVRRAVVKKFPYCIYSSEEANSIRIISVFHTSRDPSEWQRRV